MKTRYSFLLFSLFVISLFAQAPKREMRAAWLATVWRLDWPKSPVTVTGNAMEINAQKKLMIRILDSLASANMNAVCFQVRGRSDAVYASSYEPWSSDLVSVRGMDPGYDPLAFVVEEAHRRGIEVHAWVNPYRYESSVSAFPWNKLPNDYRVSHPEWILQVGNSSILNPGLPAVKQRITDVVKEIVTKYDVDGVIFDDYFYLQDITTEDADTYSSYNPKGLSLGNWRRSNVNEMISMVYSMIQREKPYVKFGVSPAGVWDVSPSIATSYGLTPCSINSGYAYSGIYCDPVAWLSEGTVDYVSPQIYWTIGSSNDYRTLANWWSYAAMHFGKHFYSSHSISALSAAGAPARKKVIDTSVEREGMSELERAIMSQNSLIQTRALAPSEVLAQIQVNRDANLSDAPGSIFFSMSKLYETTGFINQLKTEKYKYKALTPAINWKKNSSFGSVPSIMLEGRTLSWSAVNGDVRYAVYGFPAGQTIDATVWNTPNYLLGITYTPSFILPNNVSLSSQFAVAIVDRYGNEYPPMFMGQSIQTVSVPSIQYPDHGVEDLLYPFIFRWSSVPNAISYVFEISTQPDFSSLICSREVPTNSFLSSNLPTLLKGQFYYWRVKSKAIGNESTFSEVRRFSGTPFSIITPLDKSGNVSLNPTVTWSNLGEGVEYLLEVSTAINFYPTQIIFSKSYSTNTCQLSSVLVGGKTYFMRVKSFIEGVETMTDVISFTTQSVIPSVPQLLSPIPNEQISSASVKVMWAPEPNAMNFRVELSSSESFPPRSTKAKQVAAYTYEAEYTGLAAGLYYLRARSEYQGVDGKGAVLSLYTDWSPTLQFNYLGGGSDVEGVSSDEFKCKIVTSGDTKYLLLTLAVPAMVTAQLYSVSSQPLSQILNESLSTGVYTLPILIDRVSSGVYLLQIKINGKVSVLKLVY